MTYTHIIIHQGAESEILYRASDGMVIAGRIGTTVQFGENPTQTEQRQFLDKSFAALYLRKIADKDAAELPPSCVCNDGKLHAIPCDECADQRRATIEDRDNDRRIISPADAVGSGLRH